MKEASLPKAIQSVQRAIHLGLLDLKNRWWIYRNPEKISELKDLIDNSALDPKTTKMLDKMRE